ncbi:hypothetical protein ISU82_17545 [Leptospira borgpetersenii serovar Balcanica]|nr:hypothetical protein [Leptospira borgpetersenii serovar Balcanica]MBE8368415.1 hypothetical protein [Leptospira borgpetersenii serovar Balcanica]MBE8424725.1 hypothetical protein [Leptospira borgpetersenii serovar Balcanica]MBF3351804.1 hypothetical protein [Leptospira borgpetersenii serovar Balcanica]
MDDRTALAAIFYRVKTGILWRYMPRCEEFLIRFIKKL